MTLSTRATQPYSIIDTQEQPMEELESESFQFKEVCAFYGAAMHMAQVGKLLLDGSKLLA